MDLYVEDVCVPAIGTGRFHYGHLLELKLKGCCGEKHCETGVDASFVGFTTRCQCTNLSKMDKLGIS